MKMLKSMIAVCLIFVLSVSAFAADDDFMLESTYSNVSPRTVSMTGSTFDSMRSREVIDRVNERIMIKFNTTDSAYSPGAMSNVRFRIRAYADDTLIDVVDLTFTTGRSSLFASGFTVDHTWSAANTLDGGFITCYVQLRGFSKKVLSSLNKLEITFRDCENQIARETMTITFDTIGETTTEKTTTSKSTTTKSASGSNDSASRTYASTTSPTKSSGGSSGGSKKSGSGTVKTTIGENGEVIELPDDGIVDYEVESPNTGLGPSFFTGGKIAGLALLIVVLAGIVFLAYKIKQEKAKKEDGSKEKKTEETEEERL